MKTKTLATTPRRACGVVASDDFARVIPTGITDRRRTDAARRSFVVPCSRVVGTGSAARCCTAAASSCRRCSNYGTSLVFHERSPNPTWPRLRSTRPIPKRSCAYDPFPLACFAANPPICRSVRSDASENSPSEPIALRRLSQIGSCCRSTASANVAGR